MSRASPLMPPLVSHNSSLDTSVFERLESEVRTYCRSFPTVFERAKGALLFDEAGREYIDFFAAAGSLNYGHNPDFIKSLLIEFLSEDKIMQGLDMYTSTKRAFLESFEEIILKPRGLDYKVQFCGPAGVNSVEAAMKLARLVTGRVPIASFRGGWHGMSTMALSVTGNKAHRSAAGIPLGSAGFLPYPEGPYTISDTLGYIENLLRDSNSGFDLPAAILVETIQAEGGIYAASTDWLRGLRALCEHWKILLIVDDIQVGCGRTGEFFSFETAGIVPDLVCLSKSIGGYGLPMALLLMRRELDVWKPGDHTGTFRGNQMAILAGTAAIHLWGNRDFVDALSRRAVRLHDQLVAAIPVKNGPKLRGRGFIWGLDFTDSGGPEIAGAVARRAFELGLIVERCGRDDVVIKVMPPIIADDELLKRGCEILAEAMA
jgi:diaminobutyrate-2-oxoglutarate transaminase